MIKLKHFILPCLAALLLAGCQNNPKENNGVKPDNEEAPKITDEQAKKLGYLIDDVSIVNALKSAAYPKGLVSVDDNTPTDRNEGIPIIVDEEESSKEMEKSDLTTYEGIPGYWVRSKTRYRMSQSFDETLIKDPSADILYPGAVIRGNTIADATYGFFNACNTGKSTYSINATLKNGKGELLVGEADNIRMSDYRAQFNNWKQLDFNDDAVKTSCSLYHINSKEDAKFHAGASVKHAIADVVANLDFKFSQKKNHFLIKFIQQKFNVVLDQPRSRATIFTSIHPQLMENVQPVYVSNINYGRILFMAVSTDESETTVNAAIEFMLKKIKGVVDVNAQLESSYNKVQSSSNIDMTAVGGNQEQQNMLLSHDLEGAMKYMMSKVSINEVSPISFQLRYASTGQIARIVSQTEYEVPNNIFVPDFDKVIITVKPVAIRATGGRQGENDIFGTAYMESKTEDGTKQPHNLLNIPKDATMRVNNQNIFTDLHGGQRIQLTFTKKKGMDAQEFLLGNYVKFDLDLTERGYTIGDNKYQKVSETFSLSDLINIYNTDKHSMGPCFVLSTQKERYTAGVKFQIMDVQYVGNGKRIDGKINK